MKKIMSVLKIIGIIFVVILTGGVALAFMKGNRNETKSEIDKQNQELEKKIEGEKAKINSLPSEKDIKDKYSKIIPVILILIFFSATLHAEYIVYDQIDLLKRDYGSVTNYAKAGWEVAGNYRTINFSLSKITNYQASIISNQKKAIDILIKNQDRERNRIFFSAIGISLGIVVSFIAGSYFGKQ